VTGLSRALAVFDAIDSGDFSCLAEVVTADFVDHGSPIPLPPGPEGYRQILSVVHDVLQIRYTIEDAFETDGRIVIRAVARGVGVDAIHGQGAAGKAYAMPTIHIYRTADGLLAEHWGVRDEFGARIQLGVVPAPEFPAPELPKG
jgi:ketosteroid isomerase-like protein